LPWLLGLLLLGLLLLLGFAERLLSCSQLLELIKN
jgi:hypothetical protein